jgi:predicted helicase
MRLSKDKTQIIYNEFLTLSGIPQEVFTYKLGNRSALVGLTQLAQAMVRRSRTEHLKTKPLT